MTHSVQKQSNLPLSSRGQGVTICHFARQCLFVPSLNLSAMASLTCGPIFALWTWAMSSDKYSRPLGQSRLRHEWTAPNLIALLELRTPPSPARPSQTHTIIHTSRCRSVSRQAVGYQTCRSRSVSHGSSQWFYLPVTTELTIPSHPMHTTLSLVQQYTAGGSLSSQSG